MHQSPNWYGICLPSRNNAGSRPVWCSIYGQVANRQPQQSVKLTSNDIVGSTPTLPTKRDQHDNGEWLLKISPSFTSRGLKNLWKWVGSSEAERMSVKHDVEISKFSLPANLCPYSSAGMSDCLTSSRSKVRTLVRVPIYVVLGVKVARQFVTLQARDRYPQFHPHTQECSSVGQSVRLISARSWDRDPPFLPFYGAIAQFGRAPALQAGGRGFEAHWFHHFMSKCPSGLRG